MTLFFPDPPDNGAFDIRRGHATDLIESFPDFDLLVTDPPYAFGNQGTDEHALSATVAVVLREAARRLRPGRWAVVFAASSWRSTSYMVEAVRGVLDPVRFGVWTKPQSRSKVRTPGWAWATVNVIVMRRPGGDPVGTPSATLDWIEAPPVLDGRRAQLPPEVARWAVEPFAVPGGLALDPFAGSGALLRAAAAAGMAAVGFEKEGADGPMWPAADDPGDPDDGDGDGDGRVRRVLDDLAASQATALESMQAADENRSGARPRTRTPGTRGRR